MDLAVVGMLSRNNPNDKTVIEPSAEARRRPARATLAEQAQRCRRLADSATDPEVRALLESMAASYQRGSGTLTD